MNIYILFLGERMEPTTRYVLVNHGGPDTDSAVISYLWHLTYKKRIGAEDVEYVFVPSGKRLEPHLVEPGDIVFHLDTGYRFDPGTNDYDHHQDRKRWPSAARTMFETFTKLQEDPIIAEMVDLADRVDSGNTVNQEDPDARSTRQSFNGEVTSFNTGREDSPVILITEQSGPWQIVDLLSNMEVESNELQDRDKLIVSMMMLESWYNNEKKRRETKQADFKPTLDIEIFDRVAATFIQLVAKDKWLYDVDFREVEDSYMRATQDRFTSMTEAAFQSFQHIQGEPVFEELVYLVNLLRTSNSTVNKSEEADMFKTQLTEMLAEFNQGRDHKVIPITLRKGPWEVAELFPSEGYSLTARILSGLIMFKAWYNKKTVRKRINTLLSTSNWFEYSGIKYVVVPETTFTTKVIRYQLRRYLRDEVDVAIVTYLECGTGKKSIGITRVQDDVVNGMDDLYHQLKRIDPRADVFMFRPSKFVIYIKDKLDILTPQRVSQETVRTLKPLIEYSDHNSENALAVSS